MTLNNTMRENNNPEYLDDTDPEKNLDYWRQDHGGMITNHNGLADKLLQNDDLYRSMKGDWSRTAWNKGNNIRVTTGREDGKFYITREQMNTDEVKLRVKNYRHAAELGVPDPLAPIGDDGKLSFKWMELPTVISIRISDQYFDGIPWTALKNDRTLKAQFYRVVEAEYPEYVCYPGGKLPIPVAVAYPTKKGEKKYFKGH
jgi:hypothetical protein